MENGKTINDIETSVENLPVILENRFDELSILKQEIDDATNNAKLTQASAQKAKDEKPGWFNKQRLISNAQENIASIAENQVQNAEINNKIIKYQQKQAETMRFLLGLGVSNLANTRVVIKFLKEKLSETGDKKLDEIEEKEILDVIKQLKAQEDIFEKQERTREKIKKHDAEIAKIADTCIECGLKNKYLERDVSKLKKKNSILLVVSIISLILATISIVLSFILFVR